MNKTFNLSIDQHGFEHWEAREYLLIVSNVSFVLSILLIIGIVSATALGNGLLFYVVRKDKRLWIASNVFVLNLASVSLLQALSAMPLTLVYTIFRQQSSEHVCDVREFLSDSLICASFSALFLISLNRYAVLLFRLDYPVHFSKRRALAYVAATWLVSILYAAATTVYRNTSESLREYDCSTTSVDNQLPRGAATLKFVFVGFPFIGTLLVYAKLMLHFSQRKSSCKNDGSSNYHLTTDGRKRRAATKNIRVLGLTVAFLCGGQLLYVIAVFVNLLTGQVPRQLVITALGLYYFVNTANPVLFGYLNKKFKRTFKRIFHRLFAKVHSWGTKKNGKNRPILKTRMNTFKLIDLDKYNSISDNSYFIEESSLSVSRVPLLLNSHELFSGNKSLNRSCELQTEFSRSSKQQLSIHRELTRSRFPVMRDSSVLSNSSLHEELTRSRAAILHAEYF